MTRGNYIIVAKDFRKDEYTGIKRIFTLWDGK